MHRSIRPPAVALAFALLAPACDDPSSPSPDGAELPPPTGAVSALVSPDGGTLSATTDDGAIVTLTIPAGAVSAPTAVTIRPVAADAGEWFGVLLEPAGLRLLAPFELEVVLPESVELVDPVLTLGDSVPLATTFDPATRTLRTNALALFGLGAPLPPGAAPLGAARFSGGSNHVGAAPASCSQLTASAQQSFDGFIARQDFEGAMRAALSIAAFLYKAGCDDLSFSNAAARVGCERAQVAYDEVRSQPTTDYGQFTGQARRLMGWGELLHLIGATCTAAHTWTDALHQEIVDFLAFYQTRLDALADDDFETFLDLKQEAVSLTELRAEANMLGVPDADAMIRTEALVPTMTRMREVGYSLCHADGWHYPLSRITETGFFAGRDIIGVDAPRPGFPPSGLEAGFSDVDIFADIQYCGTDLDLSAIVVSGDTLASMHAGTEGTAGTQVAALTLQAPTRGSILLAGDLRALTCWNDVDADTAIDVTVNGSHARTLSRTDDGYVGAEGLLLDIGELADSAGITPQEGVSHDLVLERRRSECHDGLWGPPDYDVLTVTLDWVNPTLTVDIAFAASVAAGSSEDAVVRVAVIDQSGQPAYFPDIDVDLTVTGASATRLTGTTDSAGYFRSTIAVPENATQPVTIRALASSFEGVTAEATRQAGIAGASVTLVESTYTAYGLAWVSWSSVLDEDEQADTAVAPSGSVSAAVSASRGSAGSSSANTTFDGSVTTGASGAITAIIGSGQSSASIVADSAYPRGTAFSNGATAFQVVGAAATVHVTGSIAGAPRRWQSGYGPVRADAGVYLSRFDPEDNRTLETIIEFTTNDSTAYALDTTVVLEPGYYSLSGNSKAAGDTCTACNLEATASVSYELTVQ